MATLHGPRGERLLAIHPTVIAIPHTGGYTGESIDRTAKRTIEQLLEHLS